MASSLEHWSPAAPQPATIRLSIIEWFPLHQSNMRFHAGCSSGFAKLTDPPPRAGCPLVGPGPLRFCNPRPLTSLLEYVRVIFLELVGLSAQIIGVFSK